MKYSILVVFAAFGFASAVNADSQISYFTGSVDGTAYFPNYGEVPSEQVCFEKASNTLKTEIPARQDIVCDKSYIDHSDSTHPVTVCLESHTVSVPALELVAPMTYTVRECIKSDTRYEEYRAPIVTCLEYGMVEKTQSLTYLVAVYHPWDIYHYEPIFENRSIPSCK